MYGNHFYNESTRRYVAVFGTLFNDIIIERKNANNTTSVSKIKVPINYAPMQKILARLDQDPNLNAPAMTLPRMSFEITGMTYSAERKLTSLTKQQKAIDTDDKSATTLFTPSPYDIEFQLNIMTKYNEDASKILEQILPFFKPDITVGVKMIDTLATFVDIPVVLNSVSMEDSYEADFQTRRALIYTLNFTMKAYFFGPTSTKKLIKFIDIDMYPSFNEADGGEQIHITPGVEVTAGNFVATTIYKILDLGTASDSDWQGVGFSGTPKVGDTFTANGNGSAVTGGVVTELYTAINQDDSWKHIIEILDND
jgi:hypothetical protein